MDDHTEQVLAFWFLELKPEQHFRSGPHVDGAIRQRFLPVYERLAASIDEHAALSSAERALASIIVLDQFPRNMFRGSPRAFETDPIALRLAKGSVVRGLDRSLPKDRAKFMYLPYEHSEDLADQDASVRLLGSLGDPELTRYAEAHHVIIARFGRFPHRNATLGRASTAEEIEFLNGPNSSF